MKRPTRRRLLIGLLTVPALLVLGDFLLWRAAEQQLHQGFAQWVSARRDQGWVVTSGKPESGGWPSAATLSVPDVSLASTSMPIPGGMRWTSERLTLRVSLAQPGRLVVAAIGQQRLRLGAAIDVPFMADLLEASFPLAVDVPARATHITAAHLRAGLTAQADAGSLTIGALDARLEMRLAAAQSDAALTVALTADEIGLPAGPRWPLGPRVASLALDGTVSGPVPRIVALEPRLSAWRDSGGTLEVRHLAVAWGPLNLSATATLSLDDKLQPMGAATTRMSGQGAALDAVAAEGLIKPQVAMAAKAVLALMSAPPVPGQPPTAEVPLTLQNRTLAMGRIPLVRFPQLEWPPE